jgi:hypothetical protein
MSGGGSKGLPPRSTFVSEYDYLVSLNIAKHDYPFYALIMAAMRQADTDNLEFLKRCWPAVWDELVQLYHQPLHPLAEAV